jgi:DNA topoisomerase-3
MKLVIAEKPSVAQSLAKVIGANKRQDGYLEGDGYLVSWCVGHLVELSAPERYDERYAKWRLEDLPILPERLAVRGLLGDYQKAVPDPEVPDGAIQTSQSLVCATDAGREGELIFRLVYNQCSM